MNPPTENPGRDDADGGHAADGDATATPPTDETCGERQLDEAFDDGFEQGREETRSAFLDGLSCGAWLVGAFMLLRRWLLPR